MRDATHAHHIGPDGSIRPFTYTTMFGLIAATGMRVSEALAIRLPDVTGDGLIIAQTKFKKADCCRSIQRLGAHWTDTSHLG